MPLPTSDVGICNLSFDLIREEGIVDIEDPETSKESLAARWYDLIRMSLLQAYNWNFATGSEAIPRSGTPSISKYSDIYAFPNDFLHLRAIKDPDVPLTEYEYEIQGKSILYNNSEGDSLDVWFTRDVTNIALFDPLFINLFAAELALIFALKITKKAGILSEIKDTASLWRQRALAKNGQAKPAKKYETSRIVSAGRNLNSRNTVAGPHEFDFDPN